MEMWLWLVIVLAVCGAFVVPLWRVVRQDGLGHRPPPMSRRDAFAQTERLL